MTYTILYAQNVLKKDLRRFPQSILKQIQRAIKERLMVDPIGFGKPLRYNLKGCRRLRVGDYRIVYQIDKMVVMILAVKHRKDIYQDV